MITNQAVEALKKCGTFYLATMEGDQPRVRPFGAVVELNGKAYLCTSNQKDCFRQMLKNPKVEICGTYPEGNAWVRIAAVISVDPSMAARQAFLQACPLPMYKADDGKFEVFFLSSGTLTIAAFGSEPKTLTL